MSKSTYITSHFRKECPIESEEDEEFSVVCTMCNPSQGISIEISHSFIFLGSSSLHLNDYTTTAMRMVEDRLSILISSRKIKDTAHIFRMNILIINIITHHPLVHSCTLAE